MNEIFVIGHRGFSSIAPENTLSSFKKALEFGVDAVELDIMKSKDGELVVFHDDKLNRTTNGKGYLQNFTYNELQKLDAGIWFSTDFIDEKIPLLDNVFELLSGKITLILEIKKNSGKNENIEKSIHSSINRYSNYDKVIISSSENEILKNFQNLSSSYKLAKIITLKDLIPIKTKGLKNYLETLNISNLYSIHPHWRFVNQQFVKIAKELGLKIIPWTVNTAKTINKFKELELDGVITDYPELAATLESV